MILPAVSGLSLDRRVPQHPNSQDVILGFRVSRRSNWLDMSSSTCLKLHTGRAIRALLFFLLGFPATAETDLAGAWEALFIYDSMIFGLTMLKTWKNRSVFIFSRADSFIYLFLRDGELVVLVRFMPRYDYHDQAQYILRKWFRPRPPG